MCAATPTGTHPGRLLPVALAAALAISVGFCFHMAMLADVEGLHQAKIAELQSQHDEMRTRAERCELLGDGGMRACISEVTRLQSEIGQAHVERDHLRAERAHMQVAISACEQEKGGSRNSCITKTQEMRAENERLQKERDLMWAERETLQQAATACTQRADSTCAAEIRQLRDKLALCEKHKDSSRQTCLAELQRLRAETAASEELPSSAEAFQLHACPEMRVIPPGTPLPGGISCRSDLSAGGTECCKL